MIGCQLRIPLSRDLCPEVGNEYDRWCTLLGEDDPYLSSTTLGIHDVLKAHFLIADFFFREGEGIGGVGPRSLNLLHSAVSRQCVGMGLRRKWSDKFDICATLLFGLVKNHPFHDANKRTAFLCTLLYLYRQGRIPSVPHNQIEDFIVDVADNNLRKYARYKELVKSGSDDPEVEMISKFLRSRTRDLDKRTYTITYRDLDRILRGFGYEMINPNNNYIDIVRVENVPPGWFKKPGIRRQKIMSVGFPGWTKQVSRGDIKALRVSMNLTHEHGIDSQAFFNGLEDLDSLIAHYQEPLRRLAHR